MSNNKSKIKAKEEIIGPRPKQFWLVLSTVGLLLIVVGAFLPILQHDTTIAQMPPTFRYIYAAGAVLLLVSRLFSPYKGTDIRVKRLYRIEAWSSIFFCVGAFFLFYDTTSSRDWLAFTLAGGAIQIYASVMIPRAINKALDRVDKGED